MLVNLHTTIKYMLHTYGRIPAGEVEISFEMPTQEWVDSLMRPTINLFLFDIQENTELRQTNMQTTRGNGTAAQRMPPRRFDLRYLVSALSTEAADEHLLIWRALAALMKYQYFPPDALGAGLLAILEREQATQQRDQLAAFLDEQRQTSAKLRTQPAAFLGDQQGAIARLRAFVETLQLEPPVRAGLAALLPEPQLVAKVCKDGEAPRALDVWGALNMPPRPALLYVVTAPVDLDITIEAPLVLTRTLRTRPPAAKADESWSVGGVVRDAAGQPQPDLVVSVKGRAAKGSRTNGAGQYVLGNLQPGELELLVTREGDVLKVARIDVPSDSYDIALD